MLLELRILRRPCPTKTFDHLFADFNQWSERFRVATENEAEIDVEEMSAGREEKVVEMPVANAKDVCDDTVSSAGADVSVHGLFTHAQRASLIWVVGTEVGEDGPTVFLTYSREGDGGNKLDSACKGRSGEDTVGCEFEVKV